MKKVLVSVFVLFILLVKASFAETITAEAEVVSATIMAKNGQMAFLLKPDNVDKPIWLYAPYRADQQYMRLIIDAYNRKDKVIIRYDDVLMELFYLKIKEEE